MSESRGIDTAMSPHLEGTLLGPSKSKLPLAMLVNQKRDAYIWEAGYFMLNAENSKFASVKIAHPIRHE